MHGFKRTVSFVIIFAIMITSVFTNFSLSSSAEAVTTMYIEPQSGRVNIRSGPGTSHSIIESVSSCTATVLNANPTYDNKKYYWYNITYYNGSTQINGWVAYDEEYIRIVTYNPDADFEDKLCAFPESYRDALRTLHAAYPNWEFIPDPVQLSFNEAVLLEDQNMRKQVHFTSQPVSWRSMGPGLYDWSEEKWNVTNDNWTGASREIIAYYMDPRNFLNSTEIYMFLEQGYNEAYQTEAGVEKIVAGTFMANGYSDPNDTQYGGSYIKVIMEAARQSGVSPYIIASKIRQEIGTNLDGSSSMVSGTYTGFEGYYNFFNYGAFGADNAEILANGLTYAKNNGWNSRSAAIIGGAKNYSNGYISEGQDTYYYQDFNVHDPANIWHQYAQAIHDAYSKGYGLAKTYQSNYEHPLTFRIPIYSSMPESVTEKPASNEKANNYYFGSMSIGGLTPTFDMYTFDYDLYLADSATLYLTPVAGATYVGEESYSLTAGSNKIVFKAKAETGYTRDYVINVTSEKSSTLTVVLGEPPKNTVMLGDTDGDKQITILDLANVRLHLLNLYKLEGNNALGADTDGDKEITILDLANIRLHLLGLYTIK